MIVKTQEVKRIVSATFPDYRRREVIIEASEKVRLHDLNWSGGTKSEYRACSIDGRRLESRHDMGSPAPWNNPFEGKEVSLTPGVIMVEGGVFCGKTSILHIFVHPQDMPRMLTA